MGCKQPKEIQSFLSLQYFLLCCMVLQTSIPRGITVPSLSLQQEQSLCNFSNKKNKVPKFLLVLSQIEKKNAYPNFDIIFTKSGVIWHLFDRSHRKKNVVFLSVNENK